MKFFDPKKKDTNAGTTSNPAPPKPNPPAETLKQTTPMYSNPASKPAEPVAPPPRPEPPVAAVPVQPPAPAPESRTAPTPQKPARTVMGPSVHVHGEIKADENLIIEGVVDGAIETSKDVLVGPEGKVHASIRATNIIVSGKVKGDLSATNKVDLTASAVLQGNIRSPKLSIADTAVFNGRIEMVSPASSASAAEKSEPSKSSSAQPAQSAQK